MNSFQIFESFLKFASFAVHQKKSFNFKEQRCVFEPINFCNKMTKNIENY